MIEHLLITQVRPCLSISIARELHADRLSICRTRVRSEAVQEQRLLHVELKRIELPIGELCGDAPA